MRTFEDVLNEWTDTCLKEQRAGDPQVVVLITRLGLLGQRLVYEANQIGMKNMADHATKSLVESDLATQEGVNDQHSH